MLPFIVGAVVVGVGTYLLNSAESENKRARDEYDDTYDRVKRDIQKRYKDAQKKDMLDKLFKIKRAKQKIASSIYSELKNSQSSFKQISMQLKESKDTLSALFEQKKLVSTKEQKIDIQKNINIVIDSRKELFKIQDELKSDIEKLKIRLNSANQDVRDIQKEINIVLER